MSSGFQPISRTAPKQPASASALFRPRVLAHLAVKPAFAALSATPQPAANSASAESPPPCAQPPVLTLQREGDAIAKIHIQCGCGQIITLNCDY